jgi:hypothetical protein
MLPPSGPHRGASCGAGGLIGSTAGGSSPSAMDAFNASRSAAVVALAGMALRQLLDDARAEEGGVVAVRVAATHSVSGVAIDFELIDRAGHAIGGGSL